MPKRLLRPWCCFVAWAICLTAELAADAATEAADERPLALLRRAKRVLVLGNSITASGRYVADFEAWLVSQRWPQTPEIINAGLSSETVSGLSEEGHAGGKFPRPDLKERLERVLAIAEPDLVLACYGINCGIYQPLDEARFHEYQRGITELKAAIENRHAALILVTPPFYDDLRNPKPGFSYNSVLDHYSDWLLARRADGWRVIDLHGPMTKEIQRRRVSDPKFTLQPDGVHPNEGGHWFIAQQLIRYFGDEQAAAAESPAAMLAASKIDANVLPLVQQRSNVLRDAYVAAAGHKRPGVKAGLPLVEAREKAKELSAAIQELLPPP